MRLCVGPRLPGLQLPTSLATPTESCPRAASHQAACALLALPPPGYIKLELPVFHIGYFKNTVQLLQCICKSCSRVLLKESDRQQWLR